MKYEEKKWQKWLPWTIAIVMALWVIGGVKEQKVKSEFNIQEFAKLPVLLNGRIQPMDSVARNTLLMLRGKGSVIAAEKPQEELGFFELAKAPKMSATEWLLEAMTRPEQADKRYIFRIDNGEALALLKLPAERKYFSFNELKDGWDEVEKQSARIEKIKDELRTPFEKQIIKVQFGLGLYFRVKNTLRPQNSPSFAEELQGFQASLAPAAAALKQKEAGQTHNEQDLQAVMEYMQRYKMLSRAGYAMIIPPTNPAENPNGWMTIGGSLMDARIEPAVWAYVKLGDRTRRIIRANSMRLWWNIKIGFRTIFQNKFQKEFRKLFSIITRLL